MDEKSTQIKPSLFARRLQKILHDLKMKGIDLPNKEIARRLDLTEGTVSGYMKGRYMPNGNNLYGLANLLGVSVETLMSPSDDDLFEVMDLSQEQRRLLANFDRLSHEPRMQEAFIKMAEQFVNAIKEKDNHGQDVEITEAGRDG